MQLIKQIESGTMGFDDMKRMLGPFAAKTLVLHYDDLRQVGTALDLFRHGVTAVVVLLQIEGPDAPAVGHWIVMLNHGDTYEHFDSYGITMDEELAITHAEPLLSNLFETNQEKRLVETGLKLQEKREDVNTCGRWCVARIRLQKLDPHQFAQVIQTAHATPDITVTLMTMFL